MAKAAVRRAPDTRDRDWVARTRLASQHLTGKRFRNPVEVVRWFGAVQSQDYLGAKWAVAARMPSLTSAAFDPLLADGSIVRTHVLRPTWHFVAREDVRWMLELTGPRVQAISAPYYRKLELSPAMLRRSSDAMAKALAGGGRMTRPELTRVIQGARVPTDGIRLGFILGNAELERVICSGGLRGRQQTYALFDEQVGPGASFDRDGAVAELVLRYFRSHGPATLNDFAWWSGLTVADARKGIEAAGDTLIEERVEGRSYWTPADAPKARLTAPLVRLLANYDEFGVAYRDHGLTLDHARLDMAASETAALAHSILEDGWVVGGWKRIVAAKRATIEARPLVRLTEATRAGLDDEARRFGAFLGLPTDLVIQT
jgi:hypothetical protein